MNSDIKILLVDDEDSIKKVVEQILTREGYQVLFAEDGEKALEVYKRERPQLVILDVMLPVLDGFEVCRILRKESRVPIILLTAKSDIVDKSVGFNAGADDYLTKPFSPVELSLRVKALMRRSQEIREQEIKKPKRFEIKQEIIIDCESHEVVVRGRKVYLTPKEFELLCFMAQHPAQVFTREQLFQHLWGEEYIGDTSTITVFIRKLREKIEREPAKPEVLKTVWGVGYKLIC